MSPENEAKLLAIGPRIYCEIPSERFDVGDGWFELLRELTVDLERLDAPPIVTQVKEKFGGLRFYVRDPYHRKFGDGVHDRIAKAESDSFSICEQCGAPGLRPQVGGWTATLCSAHYLERSKARKDFRMREELYPRGWHPDDAKAG